MTASEPLSRAQSGPKRLVDCRAVVRYQVPGAETPQWALSFLWLSRLTGRYSFKRRPRRGRSMSDHNSRLNWVTVGALALFHAGALAAFFLFTWQALWIALALLWISGGWGIGMGYHRLLTHRGYETPRWLELTLTICGTLALQGGPIFWVATHRLHHRNSDKSGDPHSPRDGWWWSHAGWLVRGDPMRDAALARNVPDLLRDPFHRWLDKWHVDPLARACGGPRRVGYCQRGRVPGSQPGELGASSYGPPCSYMVLGWLILPRTPGAAGVLRPLMIRPTTGGWHS